MSNPNKSYYVHADDGHIIRTGTFVNDTERELIAAQGGTFVEGVADIRRNFVNCATGCLDEYTDPEIADRSRFLGPGFSWNVAARRWMDERDAAALAAEKKLQIEAELQRRINAPIEFANILVDADARAQAAIATKLAALKDADLAGMVPTEHLIWRDADNVIHTWPDAWAYRLWLSGLSFAIDQRRSAALAWGWAEKAALVSQH